MLMYSKFELINTEVKFLIDKKVPSIFTNIRIPNKGIVELICVHPRPPRPNEASSLQRDAELITVAKYVDKRRNNPILIFGDLNDVAWSHSTRLFKRISGTLDPRIGRGFFNTFPVKWRLLRIPLDHIFHTPSIAIRNLKVLDSIGSDHFPISATFDLLAISENSGEVKAKDRQDIVESNEIIKDSKDYDGPIKEVKKENE